VREGGDSLQGRCSGIAVGWRSAGHRAAMGKKSPVREKEISCGEEKKGAMGKPNLG